MIYKRTWLSCLLWMLFSCVTGAALAVYTILFWKKEIDTEVGYYTIVFGILAFALFICCYLLINRVIFKQGEKLNISKRTALIWEIAIISCIYSAGLIYRVYLYLQSSGISIEATEYFYIASTDSGIRAKQVLHGASSLYTFCLSFALSFFGKDVDTAVCLQIFIQMLTLLFAYSVVKKMVGKIAACVTILMLAVSSVYINQIWSITPECMFFLLYLMGMLIVGGYVKAYCNSRMSAMAAFGGAVLSGIVIGACVYLDAVSLTLFIFLPGLITGIRMPDSNKIEEKSDNAGGKTVGFSILIIGIVIIYAGLAAAGIFAIDSYISGAAYINVVKAWYNLYMAHLPIDYVLYQTEYSMVECYIQVILAAFLIISFWNSKKIQNAGPWIVMMLLMAPTPLARAGALSYQVFSIFIWSALAGIGLQQSCIALKAGSAEAAEAIPPDVQAETVRTEAMPADVQAETVCTEAMPPDVQAETVCTEAIPAETANAETSVKPRFIENPLPLPKKHERKEMDFQYDVPEDKMKFDIDIKDGDDFDI